MARRRSNLRRRLRDIDVHVIADQQPHHEASGRGCEQHPHSFPIRLFYDAVGVHHVTVTRWRLYHPTFKAELNRRRLEVLGTAADSLRAALPHALETLVDQLRVAPQRGRFAIDVLRRAGLFELIASTAAGPTTTEAFLDEEVRCRRTAAFADLVALAEASAGATS